MKYYVYAIHLDKTGNRRYNEKPFDTLGEALLLEKVMIRGHRMTDNYKVEVVSAESDQDAEVMADARRPHLLMEVNQKKDSEKK